MPFFILTLRNKKFNKKTEKKEITTSENSFSHPTCKTNELTVVFKLRPFFNNYFLA